jgi:hypothetical protein
MHRVILDEEMRERPSFHSSPSPQSTVESEVLIRKPGRGKGLECPSTPNQKHARTTRTRVPCYREEVLHMVGVFFKRRMEKRFGLFMLH